LTRFPRFAVQGAVLAIVCVAVYANGFDHAFNLDSGYGLRDNPAVRDLSNVPRFFVDPFTLTTVRENADYRPVLQATYAANHAVSGYDMWSWHLVQVLLHAACAIALLAVGRRLAADWHAGEPEAAREIVPFVAAAVFAVHPANAGVVDYLWARSSLLVAALLLPSVLLYMRAARGRGVTAPPLGSLALYALALFGKVEAVAVLAVYVLAESLEAARAHTAAGAPGGLLRDLVSVCDRRTLGRLWPFAIVTVGYGAIRARLLPAFLEDARHAEGVGAFDYLWTQTTAGWHYVGRWLLATDLVADDLSYPVYASPWAPEVLASIGGWILVAAVLRASYARSPHYTFLALSALALLAPTSSLFPLAEMVNEHRPYLPLALAGLAWTLAGGMAASRLLRSERRTRVAAGVAVSVLVVSLAIMTWGRTRAFATEIAYWADARGKAPSARSHLNYGVELMKFGKLDEALAAFRSSLELAPYWHLTHINLGLVHRSLSHDDDARRHFDEAVRYDRYSSVALRYRAEDRLGQGRYREAVTDLGQAVHGVVDPFPVYVDLARAHAGLGDDATALEYTRRCHALDPTATENAIVAISRPFWDSEDRHEAGIRYFRALATLLPDRPWIEENIGSLARGLGRRAEAEQAFARAAALRDVRRATRPRRPESAP